MIASLLHSVAIHKCVECAQGLPLLALSMTFKGGLKHGPVNSCIQCPTCGLHVRLAPRGGFLRSFSGQLLQGLASVLLVAFSMALLTWVLADANPIRIGLAMTIFLCTTAVVFVSFWAIARAYSRIEAA